MSDLASDFDHPIFSESIRLIRMALSEDNKKNIDYLDSLSQVEQDVLLRVIHSSGDISLIDKVRFSCGACEFGMHALSEDAPILTDTAMAAAAVKPMALRTFGNEVYNILDWAPSQIEVGQTRSAAGMDRALREFPGALVIIGSAPTALEVLVKLVKEGTIEEPKIVIGMPVGFVGVSDSKNNLRSSGIAHICLDGSRGGAGLVSAAMNALLRRAWLSRC